VNAPSSTLAAVGTVPVESVALILGIHRLKSQALTLANLVGNGVATLVIAKWERALDERRLQQNKRSREQSCSGVCVRRQAAFSLHFSPTIPQCESPLLIRAARDAFRQQIPKRVLRRVAAAPLHDLFIATSFSARLFYETVMG
jgi:hypothetical protein